MLQGGGGGGGGSGLTERCLVCCDKPKAPGFARKTTVLAKDEKESSRRMASTTGENRKRNERKVQNRKRPISSVESLSS